MWGVACIQAPMLLLLLPLLTSVVRCSAANLRRLAYVACTLRVI
jgi:hypothetical protein